MAYTLDAVAIHRPSSLEESNSTQYAQQRTLSGAVGRDYFGSNKRTWTMHYLSTAKTDFDTINAIYQSYLSTGTKKTWAVTETNYAVTQTNVHVDLVLRRFKTRGTDYISDFDLILTEA